MQIKFCCIGFWTRNFVCDENWSPSKHCSVAVAFRRAKGPDSDTNRKDAETNGTIQLTTVQPNDVGQAYFAGITARQASFPKSILTKNLWKMLMDGLLANGSKLNVSVGRISDTEERHVLAGIWHSSGIFLLSR